MDIKSLAQDISKGQMSGLARAITLVESQRDEDWSLAKELLKKIKAPPARSTRRIGFSGPPGVGKSTFIEKLGLKLTEKNQKVAVLAIDPTSLISGGSILGDKTRMESLSRSPLAFVRPSPNRGHLGGVTSTLPGVIQLCEAAGFQWILVESVGVGQAEIELAKMVDLFTLISQPGAGDELQGIKKGILEYVDFVLVNKLDRDRVLVNGTCQQYLSALKIVGSKSVEVHSCSGLTGEGIDAILSSMMEFFKNFKPEKRSQFQLSWFQSLIYSEFQRRVKNSPAIQEKIHKLESKIRKTELDPTDAVDLLFRDLGLDS